ncbi:ABC transporter permease [Metabacillus halosaccharovorans]|uniref:ABC-2 family transporter protein n=1 Tax=Metabacillus halosaccharovorans TaxID=930124 RepID=A0ABT3DG49_9BACI|nr:ABC-2 family transporter protein [Metabacillus halosaccharovorans]MBU7594872.1 daunorubicin ABC transporter permease [Metabacillus halosaccharovorans]MCM3444639.1 ABC-2 family transporter protein [Metabacillus halosaccharovorans]MCV9886035.1 ABC-2 family transporter protein [Metabacillus halosaccharovorans]
MDKYIEMIRIRFLMMLAYRTNYYSGILIYSINIGAYYFLWTAIYGGKESIEGLSAVQMTTYIAVSWMARAFYFNNIDREIALEIKEGKVAVELIRPYNYLGMKTMQAFGEGIFRLVFFSVPGMVIVALVFPMEFSTNGLTWLLFASSLVFSFIVNTQINLITGMLTFFLFNNDGLMRAKRVIIDLFSGLLLPISFYPIWAQDIMVYFPFQAISYIPSMIFTEGIKGNEVLQAILLQGFWAFVLFLPIQVLWAIAKKRMIIQGG